MNSQTKKIVLILMGGIALASFSMGYANDRNENKVNSQIQALSSKDSDGGHLDSTITTNVSTTRRDSANTANTGSHYLYWGDVSDPSNCALPTGHPYTDQGDGTFCADDGPYSVLGSRITDIRCFEQSLSGGDSSEQFDDICVRTIGPIPSGMATVTCPINILECPPPAPTPMILVYNTDLGNGSPALTLGLGGTVDVVLDWGVDASGCPSTITSPGAYTCNYSSGGEKIVQILGSLEHFGNMIDFEAPAVPRNSAKLVRVESFGTELGITSLEHAFDNERNLVYVPNLLPEGVTNLSDTFRNAEIFNSPIDSWDVSSVTSLTGTFLGAREFNQSLNSWDVSSVTSMTSLFNSASEFNQPLSNWDVSNVVSLESTFSDAHAFNQNINNWDTSNVTNLRHVFSNAINFDQPLNNWDTSNVTSIGSAFSSARSFNQPLNNWNVSNTSSLISLFYGAHKFNQNINNWDVSNVTSFQDTFRDAREFNQPLDNWDVSSAESIAGIFYGALIFNQNINNWDVSNVIFPGGAFRNTNQFNQPLDNWDVSSATNFASIFERATAFNQSLDNWDVSSATNFASIFERATAFNQPLDNWDVSSAVNMSNAFYRASSFNQQICSWDVSYFTSTPYRFMLMSGLENQNAPQFSSEPTWGSNCP